MDIFNQPSLDLPDLGNPITADNVNGITQPVANQNGSGIIQTANDALKGLLGLFDTGYQVYQDVNQKTGGASAQVSQNVTAPSVVRVGTQQQPAFVLGLSVNQILLIAGGLAAILIIPRLIKR